MTSALEASRRGAEYQAIALAAVQVGACTYTWVVGLGSKSSCELHGMEALPGL